MGPSRCPRAGPPPDAVSTVEDGVPVSPAPLTRYLVEIGLRLSFLPSTDSIENLLLPFMPNLCKDIEVAHGTLRNRGPVQFNTDSSCFHIGTESL